MVPAMFLIVAAGLFAKALTGRSADEQVGEYLSATVATVGFVASGITWLVLWVWLPNFQ